MSQDGTTDRVLTVPNALSALRLVGVPFFLWLILAHHDGWALVLLMVSGFTDYLDGKIARRFGLISPLGKLLDPAADRLYILATLLGLAWRHVVPWWLVVVLLGREVFIAALLPALKTRGLHRAAGPLPRQGGDLLPALRLPAAAARASSAGGSATSPSRSAGPSPGGGPALYWAAGVLYAVQTRQVLRATPRLARVAG